MLTMFEKIPILKKWLFPLIYKKQLTIIDRVNLVRQLICIAAACLPFKHAKVDIVAAVAIPCRNERAAWQARSYLYVVWDKRRRNCGSTVNTAKEYAICVKTDNVEQACALNNTAAAKPTYFANNF